VLFRHLCLIKSLGVLQLMKVQYWMSSFQILLIRRHLGLVKLWWSNRFFEKWKRTIQAKLWLQVISIYVLVSCCYWL